MSAELQQRPCSDDSSGDEDERLSRAASLAAADDAYFSGGDDDDLPGGGVAMEIDHEFDGRRLDLDMLLAWADRVDDLDVKRAMNMLHERGSVDYGDPEYGAECFRDDDVELFPIFSLDMLGIVGTPLKAITQSQSAVLQMKVEFTLRDWAKEYGNKHIISELPFGLGGRTLRLGTCSLTSWYVVLHPVAAEARVRRPRKAREPSCLSRRHARQLASYITGRLARPPFEAYGISSSSFFLGSAKSVGIHLGQWARFQSEFVADWEDFVELHGGDEFWRLHEPAFHAYDYGGNDVLDVGPRALWEAIPREVPSRREYGEEDMGGAAGASPDAQAAGDGLLASVMSTMGALYADLERLYVFTAVDRISYALAADFNVSERTTRSTLCPLSDRREVARQYGSTRDFTFYPLAFNPLYGNFTSKEPPQFLRPLASIMRDNMSVENNGAEVLSLGYFQGYSNLKQIVRPNPDELLVTQGLTTAALTLPLANASGVTRNQQSRLLRTCLGDDGLGGDDEALPGDTCKPFAREDGCIERAIRNRTVSFRMEQVVTVRADALLPQNRTTAMVLRPLVQLMRFYMMEKRRYACVFRLFPRSVFPGILRFYTRMFELILDEMYRRWRRDGRNGLNLVDSEVTAFVDRLGAYAFTGDARYLPPAVMGPLGTIESIATGAWPYISPDMLDMRATTARINIEKWPAREGEPLLLHLSALSYRYGHTIALARCNELWFHAFGHRSKLRGLADVDEYVSRLIERQWVPQTQAFVMKRLRLGPGTSARPRKVWTAEASTAIERWEDMDDPFGDDGRRQLLGLLNVESSAQEGLREPSGIEEIPITCEEYASDIYKKCLRSDTHREIAPSFATWPSTLQACIGTKGVEISAAEWVRAIKGALMEHSVKWAPWTHNKRLTVRRVVILRTRPAESNRIRARPGTSRYDSLLAHRKMKMLDERAASPPRNDTISLEGGPSFETMPRSVRDAFQYCMSNEKMQKDGMIRGHYRIAWDSLQRSLDSGDTRARLLLTLALTGVSLNRAPEVKSEDSRELLITLSARSRDASIFAASLITKMVWFLCPGDFGDGVTRNRAYSIREMNPKLEQKGVQLRLLIALGWIENLSTRPNPRVNECRLTSDEVLMRKLYKLESLYGSADHFLTEVFGRRDEAWRLACRCVG